MFSLDDKTALITGAGQGVGLGIATALAQQGAKVLINDIVAERAAQAASVLQVLGLEAQPLSFDVTDRQAVDQAIGQAGNIDILVNNAGNAGDAAMPQMPFSEMPAELIERFIDINLQGVIHCTQAVLAGMQQRQWGRVITVSSEAGRVGLNIGVSAYGAAKAGATSLMRHLSQEVGAQHITANSISLGLMNNVPEAFAAKLIRGIPTGRLGTPEDAGAMAVFLASPEASWITGQTLVLNGGANAG